MEIRQSCMGTTPVISVSGEVDHSNGYELLEAGRAALELGASSLLLDLTDCVYMDSGGIGAIMALVQQLEGKGTLGVFGANPRVQRVMTIVALSANPGFRLFGGAEDARAASSTQP